MQSKSEDFQRKSRLITNESPILVAPSLLSFMSTTQVMVLQQIYYWITVNIEKESNFVKNKYWTYITVSELSGQLNTNKKNVERAIKHLEGIGVLMSGNFNKKRYDRTKWYTINGISFKEITGQNVVKFKHYDFMDIDKLSEPIPKSINKIENKRNNGYVIDIPNIETKDKTVTCFILHYMSTLYKEIKGENHPNLKREQLEKVYLSLTEFGYDLLNLSKTPKSDLNEEVYEDFILMAKAFFEKVHNTDHNIIHFCEPTILENRFYEVIYQK